MKKSAQASKNIRDLQVKHSTLPSSSKGFTLVELLLVVSIVGVLMAIGLPQINGIYENQKLTNTANELVSEIKSLQNKALANNQDRFAVSKANGGPLLDCLPSPANRPYVDGYKLTINTDERGYETSFVLRTHNKAGSACPHGTSVNDRLATSILPPGIKFGGGEANKSIVYDVVSGKILLSGNPSRTAEELTLSNERLPSTAQKYHICINQGRVYAKTSACP